MGYRVEAHDAAMSAVVDDVLSGKIKRLIVSIPPGYKKTITFVIMLIARGFALNPNARFIHSSYADTLVQENSSKIRDAILCEEFQSKWPLTLREDTKAKGLWRTTQGGGLLAKPARGTITGFRAGTLEPGFTGALVVDDPLKTDDVFTAEREKVNGRWHSTFKSRLAREDVPVIVVMQRLHTDDFAGMLLKGGADGQKWHHLLLPIEIDNAEPYPAEFTHGIPIPHGLPDGPLNPEKHNKEHIEQFKQEPFTYASQYGQRPSPAGGVIFKEHHLAHRWRELPNMLYRKIFVDTAQKLGEENDYTVFELWGAGVDGNAYLIDLVRSRLDADMLLSTALAFWEPHFKTSHPAEGHLRCMAIEDKVSGTGLIQQLPKRGVPVEAIKRVRGQDKRSRALDVIPSFAAGRVFLPAEAPWLTDYVSELLAFDGKGTGHDDQVDPTSDAVKEICVQSVSMSDVL